MGISGLGHGLSSKNKWGFGPKESSTHAYDRCGKNLVEVVKKQGEI